MLGYRWYACMIKRGTIMYFVLWYPVWYIYGCTSPCYTRNATVADTCTDTCVLMLISGYHQIILWHSPSRWYKLYNFNVFLILGMQEHFLQHLSSLLWISMALNANIPLYQLAYPSYFTSQIDIAGCASFLHVGDVGWWCMMLVIFYWLHRWCQALLLETCNTKGPWVTEDQGDCNGAITVRLREKCAPLQ